MESRSFGRTSRGSLYSGFSVVLNDEVLIWFGPNGYNHGKCPYIVAPYIPVPGQIYGLSGVKHAIPSAEVVDKAVDLSLRIAAWAARPAFLKNISDKTVQKHGDLEVKFYAVFALLSQGARAFYHWHMGTQI